MPRGMVHSMSSNSMPVIPFMLSNVLSSRGLVLGSAAGKAWQEDQYSSASAQTLDQQLSEKRRWSLPMPAYRRERAAQAQRARHLAAVQAALQQRAAASELARCFLRGTLLGCFLQQVCLTAQHANALGSCLQQAMLVHLSVTCTSARQWLVWPRCHGRRPAAAADAGSGRSGGPWSQHIDAARWRPSWRPATGSAQGIWGSGGYCRCRCCR